MMVRLMAAITLLVCAACTGTHHVGATVLTAPDADPWQGPDAATTAVITLLNGVSPPQSVPVVNGVFTFSVEPASPSETSRLEIQAMRGDEVVGTGITSAIEWATNGQDVTVLVQPPDTVVAAPWFLSAPRSHPQVLELPGGRFYAVSVDPGSANLTPNGYDTVGNVPTTLRQRVPSWCDDHCAAIPTNDGWMLTEGQPPGADCTSDHPQEAAYDGNGMASSVAPENPNVVPARRCDYVDSTVVVDTVNPYGAWLVGGRHAGAYTVDPVTRLQTALAGRVPDVDTFAAPSQQFVTQDPNAPLRLLVPRTAPQVVVLVPPLAGLPTPPVETEWLVGGGQDLAASPRPALLERFDPSAASGRGLVALPDALNDRDQIALVCAARAPSGSCDLVLALGGADHTGAVVAEDLVIDGRCLASPGTCTSPLVAHLSLLQHRRRGARAVFAAGGSIVVTGGYDPSGQPVYGVESIDVSTASVTVLPAQGHVVQTLRCANPAALALDNGSVAIVGGSDARNLPCADVLFYRR